MSPFWSRGSIGPGSFGKFLGSGKKFDWSIVEAATLPRPFFLAGGLTPENVEEAIRTVRPDGVDVSSGVEGDLPGVKSGEKMRRFVEAARSAWAKGEDL